jgi:hypothetical protein
MTAKPTPCQEEALQVLRSRKNVFLTGAAGVGKSWLLSQFLEELADAKRRYAVTASSGVAAMIVGGRTLHSYMRVGLGEEDIDYLLQERNNQASYEVRQLDVLIIDEISMLSGEFFEKVEALCRHDKRNDRPWGGIQVVVVGDGGQLPPVSGGWVFATSAWKRSQFVPVMLRTQVRATDQEFANTLTELRSQGLTRRVWDLLEKAYLEDPEPSWVRLYARRADADTWNMKQLYELTSTPTAYTAIEEGHPGTIKGIKAAMPVPERLVLAVGAYVMFRVNNPPHWVNGSTGYVRKLAPDYIEVEMADVKGKPSGAFLTLRRHEFGWRRFAGEPMRDVVKQFPIQLAWGVTIHRCQGATLDHVAVDLRRLWEPGQAYVALSRVRSGEGLAVMGWTNDSFVVDPFIKSMYEKIEELHDRRRASTDRVSGGADPHQPERAAIRPEQPAVSVEDLVHAAGDPAWEIPDIECPVRVRSLPDEGAPGDEGDGW